MADCNLLWPSGARLQLATARLLCYWLSLCLCVSVGELVFCPKATQFVHDVPSNATLPSIPADMAASLSGKLRAQNFNRFDDRWFGEQFGRLRHERFGDGAVQMSLASAFVGEGIEDTEGRRPQAQREPYRRCCFLVGKGKSRFQKLCDLVFF